jgi:hypothetical protein
MTEPATLGKDERYFEGATDGWLIVTSRGKPLLYDGQLPMYWNRQVARSHLQPWMAKGGCRVVRASVRVKPSSEEKPMTAPPSLDAART